MSDTDSSCDGNPRCECKPCRKARTREALEQRCALMDARYLFDMWYKYAQEAYESKIEFYPHVKELRIVKKFLSLTPGDEYINALIKVKGRKKATGYCKYGSGVCEKTYRLLSNYVVMKKWDGENFIRFVKPGVSQSSSE